MNLLGQHKMYVHICIATSMIIWSKKGSEVRILLNINFIIVSLSLKSKNQLLVSALFSKLTIPAETFDM